ncbi:type 4a pilus biogenesis protein PilO [Patescibacteria group bacterium]|nr:type 4a pilus biogenesis protein PilO [Patescibacteria group bacterium]
MSKDLSDNKYIASNNNKKIEALVKLKADYRDIAYERERLEAYIPEGKEASDIIKDLENMAGADSLSFAAYQVDSPKSQKATDADDPQVKKGDDYQIFTFKIELNGSYTSVDKMIGEIEKHDRLLEIKKISYTPQNKIGDKIGVFLGSDNIKATLLINAYLRK